MRLLRGLDVGEFTEEDYRICCDYIPGTEWFRGQVKMAHVLRIADIKKTLTQKEDKDRVALLEKRVEKLERQLAQSRH